MPDTITLTSTTDDERQVRSALGLPDVAEKPASETAITTAAEPATEDGEAVAAEDEAARTAANPQQAAAGKRRGRLQSRIDELVDERDRERGQVSALKAEVDAYRQRLGQTMPAQADAKAEPKVAAVPKPTVDQFKTYEDYTEAVAHWAVTTQAADLAKKIVADELRGERERQRQESASRQQQALHERWNAGAEAARAKYEDFDEVINDPAVKASDLMIDQLRQSEIGAEVAYYLGSHPEDGKRLFALGNTPQALKEFGKIEARVEGALEAAAAPTAARGSEPAAKSLASVAPPAGTAAAKKPDAKAPAVTKAPDPITPVGTTEGGGSPDMSTADYQTFRAWRNASEAKRLGLR